MNTPTKNGILVAADERIEWLLPWWWSRYEAHNDFPVAFVDLGMSNFGTTFCEKKGLLIPLDLETPLDTSTPHASEWRSICGDVFFENRKRWFQKPLAFLKTPFERTLWLDLDCEVLGPLAPLFSLEGDLWVAQENEPSLKRAREEKIIEEGEMLYNSGVVLFSSTSPILEKWVELVLSKSQEFWSDQHALSRLIHQEKIPIGVLHENFNWRMTQGFNLHAVIIHWVGSWGKEYIRRFGGIGDELSKLPRL